MSVLADTTIKEYLTSERLKIDPMPRDHCIQPASIDLHLADDLVKFVPARMVDLANIKETQHTRRLNFDTPDSYVLGPSKFVLGRTVERVEIPDDLVARVEGKSSLGRVGLAIHSTAGYIDPGFKGTITLEITNLNNVPLILHAGQSICQLSLFTLSDRVARPYGHPGLKSKYQGQTDTTVSRYER